MPGIVVSITEKGGVAREEVFDQDDVTFGRVQGNDVVLPKGNISKRHARVVLRDGKLIVVDLKTTNGTFVNGKRISSPQVLKDGDRVYLGDFTVEVREGTSASVRPSQGSMTPPRPTPPAPLPPPPPPPRPGHVSAAGHGPRVLVEGEGIAARVVPLERAVVGIGRHPENQIIIDDKTLSRFHARIERRGDRYVVLDLGAQNPVRVNDARVDGERALSNGDRIRCGRATLSVFGIGPGPDAPEVTREGGGADDLSVATQILSALRSARVREVELREGEPVSVAPAELTPADATPLPRRVILVLLQSMHIPLSDARPVFDGQSSMFPEWRVTAQALDGAPARARFRRTPRISLDDDLDPIPPG